MKTKLRRLIVSLGLCSTLVLTGFGVANVLQSDADSVVVSLEGGELEKDSFTLGEELNVPDGTIKVGTQEYQTDAVVHFPSGDAYLADTVVLNQTGVYTLEYRSEVEGNVKSVTKNFTVLEGLLQVSSELSSIKYGNPLEEGVPFTTERSPNGYIVSLAKGDVFTYTGVIDLNHTDTRNKMAFQYYVTPEKDKTPDVYTVYTKFTDIYDPNNYVIVSQWSYNMKDYDGSPCRANYVTTCVPSIGQNYTGHYEESIHYTEFRPVNAIWKNMTTSGFCSFMSFYGNNANGDLKWYDSTDKNTRKETTRANAKSWDITRENAYTGRYQMGFWWDYQNRRIYSEQPDPGLSYASYGYANGDSAELLADYDDPGFYNSLWDGFTTGECYVSMWGADYNNSSFNFVVTALDANDLSASKMSDTYEDAANPELTVNFGKYTETTLPKAHVGDAYPIFSCKAYDAYDDKDEQVSTYSVRVFFGEDEKYEISCDDTFTPNKVGKYVLKYQTSDRAGNKAEKKVIVEAVESVEPIQFEIDTASAVKTGVRGISVPMVQASYSGGIGELTYTVIATNKSTGTKYSATTGSFRPMEVGTYSVEYKVVDFIGQTKSASYDVEVSESTGPIFKELPTLPKYLTNASDATSYVLPVVSAYDEVAKKDVQASIYLKDGASEELLRGGVLNIDGDTRDVKIVYRAVGQNGTTNLEFTIPYISVNPTGRLIRFDEFFKGENIKAESSSSVVLLTANGAGKANAEFINAVLSEGLSLNFQISQGNFSQLNMVLTDSKNEAEEIKFSWKNEAGTHYVYVNGEKTLVSTSFDFAGTESNFTWKNSTLTFTDNTSSSSVVIDKTVYGEAFGGFSSGKVYVRFEMEGITQDGAELTVSKINNQTMKNVKKDGQVPQFMLLGNDYAAQYYTREKIVLCSYAAADVISPNTVVKLSLVKDPNGTPASEQLDATQKQLVITEAGEYALSYVISDGIKEAEVKYVFTVVKASDIELTLNGSVPTSATLNTQVALPTATAKDSSGNLDYRIYLVDTRGKMKEISKSTRTFTPTIAGNYKVIYVSYDANWNSHSVQYTINVK